MARLGPVVATASLPSAAGQAGALRAALRAGADRAEARLDLLADGEDPSPLLGLAGNLPLLVSASRDAVRPHEIPWLRRAQACGAWVDLPWAEDLPGDLFGLDRDRLVLSFHEASGVSRDLHALLARLRGRGAAVCKIVAAADDALGLLPLKVLLEAEGLRGDLCAFATGGAGSASRTLGLAWGSCAVYTAAPGCPPAAPGQPGLEELLRWHDPRRISAEDPAFAVTGWPLHRTGSPALHNPWLRALGLRGCFVPLPAPDLEALLGASPALGLRGLAVTIPHKERAPALADRVSRLARRVGAANTLLRTGGGWLAANTDVFGVRMALRGIHARGRVLLLGAGGAAASVLQAIGRGAAVAVASRDPARARSLARRFGAESVAWGERAAVPWDLLVNATPAGQEGADSPYPFDLKGSAVFDLVVREDGTPLLREARGAGLTAVGGEVMLEAQARLQFRLFTGRRPPGR